MNLITKQYLIYKYIASPSVIRIKLRTIYCNTYNIFTLLYIN